MSMYIIGLDVGTTHIKAVLLDETFNVGSVHIEDSPRMHGKDKKCYFDPEELWIKSLDCIKGVMKDIDPGEVAAIGVTSMAEAGVPLDEMGQALYPIIPWNDMRGQENLNRLQSMLGTFPIYKKTGLICHPKYSISKIMWLKENHSDIYKKMKIWLSVADYIIYRISGELVTDESLAARTMLYNIVEREWDRDLTKFIDNRSILPKVIPLGGEAGVIKERLARELCMNINVKIVAAGHDHLCAAVAVGIDGENEVLDSIGTSEVFVGVEEGPKLSYESFQLGFNHGCFIDGKYYWMTSLPASGGSIEWIKNLLSANGDISYDVFTDDEKYKEATAIYYFPYLNGSGTPHVDSSKRGMFFGLSSEDDIYELIKAVYEGISYESRWIIESIEKLNKLKIRRIKVVGGASKNHPWIATKCNIMGKNIICSSLSEAAAVGAAMLAGRSAGLIASVDELSCREYAGNVEFTVDSEMNRLYNKKFMQYKHIYRVMEKIYESGELENEDNEIKRVAKDITR